MAIQPTHIKDQTKSLKRCLSGVKEAINNLDSNGGSSTESYPIVSNTISGPFTFPNNMRHYSLVVDSGPVIIDGQTRETGFIDNLNFGDIGGLIESFSIDGTGGSIIIKYVI